MKNARQSKILSLIAEELADSDTSWIGQSIAELSNDFLSDRIFILYVHGGYCIESKYYLGNYILLDT